MNTKEINSSSTFNQMPQISIISTMYRSRPFLEIFLDTCLETLSEMQVQNFEIVLVNDGSPDSSLAYALERKFDVPELVVIDLSRNFGHHNAMQAALHIARGELIFMIDCDMEVSPASLPMFYNKLMETSCDLVYGYQEYRKGGWFERLSGGLFWKGFNWLSDTKIPESISTERIMTRRFVDALLKMGDHNLFLGGMMIWTGFSQIGLPLKKKMRKGKSTYTLSKRIKLMANAVSSFSSYPLIWLFNTGITITLFSFGYGIYLIFRKLVFDDTILGFTSIMAFMAFSLGILTTSIGILGIYTGKIFNQVQNRPNYIIKDIYR